MKKIYTYMFVLLGLVYSAGSLAQTDSTTVSHKKNNTVYTLAFEQGPMMPTGSALGIQLANATYYNGLNFRVGQRKTDFNDVYNQVYRYPEMGFGAYAATFKNEIIGYPLALYYFFRMPLGFEKAHRINFSYLCGLGFVSNLRPYDATLNPNEVYLGSITNAYINFKLQATYPLSEHWSATAAVGFKHFSNGSSKQPNKGINLLPLTLAVNYRPEAFKAPEERAELPKFIPFNLINIAYTAGFKNYVYGDPTYFKTALGINAMRAISYKYKLGIGLDMFYSGGYQFRQQEPATFSNSVSFAAVGSWEWSLNKHLYVPLAIGVYLKRNPLNGEKNSFYERAGIRYRFDNNMFCGVAVKAHMGTAEFVEWTIGYTIANDQNKYRR